MKVVVKQVQKHEENHIVYIDVVEDDGSVLFSKSIIFTGDESDFSMRLDTKLGGEIKKSRLEKEKLANATEKVHNIIDDYNKRITKG